MKTTAILPFLLTLALAALMTACNPEPPLETEAQLENDDAVELITAAVQEQSGGLEEYLAQLITVVDSLATPPECDSIYQDGFALAYQGQIITSSYDADWHYQLNCDPFGLYSDLDFAFGSTGIFSTNRINSSDSVSFQGLVADIQFYEPTFALNGTFYREGNQTFTNPTETLEVNSDFTMELSDLMVAKYINPSIQSGEGTISLSGEVQGNAFNFTGDIEFLGNKTATLTINGNTYSLDWN